MRYARPTPNKRLIDMNLRWAVVGVLALGILPSFNQLSQGLFQLFPVLSRFSGPINFLKLGMPLLLYFAWQERKAFSARSWLIIGALASIGTLSTLIGAWRCQFPPGIIREWFVICLGFLAAFCFWRLPRSHRLAVVGAWSGLVFLSAVLDFLWPPAVDWLYEHIFDPQTRVLDNTEAGGRVLTGIFGRQSLAKLLCWLPWLLSFVALDTRKKIPIWCFVLLLLLAIIASAGTFATSQRGPFLAAIVAWIALGAHQVLYLRHREFIYVSIVAIIFTLMTVVVIMPEDLLRARVESTFGIVSSLSTPQSSQLRNIADSNKAFRINMTRLSLKVIATHPFGNACLTAQDFYAENVTHFSHAHNLFLQQFRERGWAWGLIHLCVWLIAWVSSWRLRSNAGSALFAGITAIVVAGMFDHAWQVLNHSLVMWATVLAAVIPRLHRGSPKESS